MLYDRNWTSQFMCYGNNDLSYFREKRYINIYYCLYQHVQTTYLFTIDLHLVIHNG